MPSGIYKRTKKMCNNMSKAQFRNKSRNKGIPLSEETKTKMSKAHIGIKLSEEHKKKIGKSLEGRKLSKEWRQKISKALSGNKSHLWKGGVTPENYKIRNGIEYKLWRSSVFSRDGWMCQLCGIKSDKLRAHHIYNFSQHPELRFAIDNGITFCEKCHKKFHKKYGIQNNSQDQINEFIQQQL